MALTYGSKYDSGGYYDWYPQSVMIDSTHILVCGHNDTYSSKGYAQIGTISGSTITWGTAVVYNNATIYSSHVAMLDSTTCCIVYRDGNNYFRSIIGNISGTTITFGTRDLVSSPCKEVVSVEALDSSTVFVSWNDGDDAYNAIGTVSGTVITWGTPEVFNPNESEEIASVLIDSNTVMMCCYDKGTFMGKAVIATISGSTISYGSLYTFNEAVPKYISLNLIDSTHILITFNDYTSNVYNLVSVVATRSGTDLTFGGKDIIYTAGHPSAQVYTKLLDSTHSFSVYNQDTSSAGSGIIGTIDGTDITYDTPVEFSSNNIKWPRVEAIDSSNAIIWFRDETDITTYGVIGSTGAAPPSGWSGKINGFEPAAVNTIDLANIAKINTI